jgi:TIR domain
MLPDDDRSKPFFFFSYAHVETVPYLAMPYANGSQQEPDDYAVQFFHDVSSLVVAQIDRRPGVDPGFIDRSMEGGRLWTDELLHMLGSCQVFVALLSPAYITSDWCGMEWNAFSERTVTRLRQTAPDHEACIIPVIWTRVREHRKPSCIRKVQPFLPSDLPDPDAVRRYKKDGVLGLLNTGPTSFYRGIILRLAQRIAELYDDYQVESRKIKEAELRNIFQEQAGD